MTTNNALNTGTTPIAVSQGGTNSTTASAARTALGTAASGANSDITSLSAISTPLSVAQGGIGAATLSAHGVLLGEGTSAITPVVLGAGQVLIGTTASDPSAATLTAGSGISINSVSGAVTISSTGDSPWTVVSSTSATMVANNGYISNNAGLVTLTLPATAAVGDRIPVAGLGAGGWKIAQVAGQTINFGGSPTTTGTGGSLASTNQYDSLELLCIVANTTYSVLGPMGNITVV